MMYTGQYINALLRESFLGMLLDKRPMIKGIHFTVTDTNINLVWVSSDKGNGYERRFLEFRIYTYYTDRTFIFAQYTIEELLQ